MIASRSTGRALRGTESCKTKSMVKHSVGEPNGGEVKPFTYLTERFIPLMRSFGIDDRLVGTMTVANPARAFMVRRPITDTRTA